MACAHCGTEETAHRWSVSACANAREEVEPELCTPCDIALNELVLRFINHPEVDRLMAAYRRKLELKP